MRPLDQFRGVLKDMTYGTMPLKFHSSLCAERDKKMYRSFFFTVFLATAMAGMQAPSTQTASANAPANNSDASPGKNVPPASPNASPQLAASDPVITIHGLCNAASTKPNSNSCTTVVTRQQFDEVVNGLNAIGAPLLPIQRRSAAEGYAKTLINYEAAKKAGVERDPRFAEVMRLARMRAMGDMYNAMMQEKAKIVKPQEIEAYYNQHRENLEELTLRRIVLPRYNSSNLKDEAFAAKARKKAEEMRDRAAKGEDLDNLQKEAFEALGVKDPPTTHMAPVRRGVYAAEQEKQLFALKPGEITGIFEQPSTFLIFKLEKRETPTLEKAKDEIARAVVQQHMEEQDQAKNLPIDYAEQYLGPAQPSTWMPASQLKPQSQARSASGSKNPPEKSGSK